MISNLPNQVIIGANVDYDTLKVFLKWKLPFEDGDISTELISFSIHILTVLYVHYVHFIFI